MAGLRPPDNDPPLWHLTESRVFWYIVERPGLSPRELDAAIDAMEWAIARDPWYYPASDDERVASLSSPRS
jgi:hypothetical protein